MLILSRYQSIDRIVDAAISVFKFQSIGCISTSGIGDGRRRTKLVRRTRNGSSPYFCVSSRPVHPSGSGSHYRSMDGRGGKGEKGSSSVRTPSSRGPLSLCLPPCVPSPLLPLSSSEPVSLVLSLKTLLSPPLPHPLPAPPRPSVFII